MIQKLAEVCYATDGTPYFLMHEKYYDSRDGRAPRWSPRFFGTYAQCMDRVISWSGCCEGGSLSGTAKTPESYIAEWRTAFAAPVVLRKTTRRAQLGTNFHDVPVAQRPAINAVLAKHGLPETQDALLCIDMQAPGSLAALAELTSGTIEGLSIWRMFSAAPSSAAPQADLGVAAKVEHSPVSLGNLQVYTVSGANDGWDPILAIFANGMHLATNYPSGLLHTFLNELVAPAERDRPGVAEAMISAFRKTLKSAAPINTSSVVYIDTAAHGVQMHEWQARLFGEIAQGLGLGGATSVSVPLAELAAAGAVKYLSCMPAASIRYSLAAPVQMDLLAA